MRYLVPVVVLAFAALVLLFGDRWSPASLALAALGVLLVLLADWLKTNWYERKVAELRSFLRDALATLQESDELPRSVRSSAQD